MWAEKVSPVNSAKCSMSSSVTARGPAVTESPMRSSASDLRNGGAPASGRRAPRPGQGLADRVDAVVGPAGPGHPATPDGGEHVGRGLDGGALHVVQHAT